MSLYRSFETERLILKPTSEEDAAFIFELLNTPKWKKFIGDRNVNTIEEAKNYIQIKFRPQLKRLGYSTYTVIRKTDHAKMGICGLYDREGIEGIDIGFAFLSAYEHMGYAFEAAHELKRAGIEEFGIASLKAITAKENVSSQKLLIKLGFIFKKLVILPNSEEELLLYEFTNEHSIK
ncbi:GNAT family N-acetyltransferase [Pontibacter arcticus]|uniref:N-acetyltransferase n=1 Tax=Pontibacter arcticus TaxID=2080288 RepID=A0A364RE51_9BACT|nr:GNAT family N-acetyltransferase [Pontibacter arcticus]RAU82620.1 N-acetyltransferase [Pontibacter arcticus]